MSALLYGCFEVEYIDNEKFYFLKRTLKERNLYLWTDDEVEGCGKELPDIIIKEVPKLSKLTRINFCLSEQQQLTNSYDLLYPWGEYEYEELCAENSSEKFNFVVKIRLMCCFNLFKIVLSILNAKNIHIFVADSIGYFNEDLDFKKYIKYDDIVDDIVEGFIEKKGGLKDGQYIVTEL